MYVPEQETTAIASDDIITINHGEILVVLSRFPETDNREVLGERRGSEPESWGAFKRGFGRSAEIFVSDNESLMS